MDFGAALSHIRAGRRVTRRGWNGKGQYVRLVSPNQIRQPSYLEITTVDGVRVPWVASQTDLLGFDWEVVP